MVPDDTATESLESAKTRRLAEVTALIDARHAEGERALMTRFTGVYYGQLDPEDVIARSAEDAIPDQVAQPVRPRYPYPPVYPYQTYRPAPRCTS